MSTETTTKKKSILTTAMENVRAKQNDETTDEGTITDKKITRKQIAIGIGAVAGTAAVLTLAIKIFTGQSVEDETSEEETVTED